MRSPPLPLSPSPLLSLSPSLLSPFWVPFLISLGAVFGALCRYYLTRACVQRWGLEFPFGTLAINVSGSFAIGVLATVLTVPEVRLFVVIGFLGAYTTFSTYELEISTLWKTGQWRKALLYWLGSAILGLGGAVLGAFVAPS